MDNCTVFNKQTVEERSRTLTKKKLCYGCHMLITADHNATTCSNRRISKICNQKHLTGLHEFVPKEEAEITLVQLNLQLILQKMTTLVQRVYQLSVTLLTWMQNVPQQESQLKSSA